jgi:hypothetical protein
VLGARSILACILAVVSPMSFCGDISFDMSNSDLSLVLPTQVSGASRVSVYKPLSAPFSSHVSF